MEIIYSLYIPQLPTCMEYLTLNWKIQSSEVLCPVTIPSNLKLDYKFFLKKKLFQICTLTKMLHFVSRDDVTLGGQEHQILALICS